MPDYLLCKVRVLWDHTGRHPQQKDFLSQKNFYKNYSQIFFKNSLTYTRFTLTAQNLHRITRTKTDFLGNFLWTYYLLFKTAHLYYAILDSTFVLFARFIVSGTLEDYNWYMNFYLNVDQHLWAIEDCMVILSPHYVTDLCTC